MAKLGPIIALVRWLKDVRLVPTMEAKAMRLTKLIVATSLIFVGSFGAAQSGAETDGEPAARQVGQAGALPSLISQYHAASDLVRPTLARQIARLVRGAPASGDADMTRAKALLVVSTQAAADLRKDLALSSALEASELVKRGDSTAHRALAAQSAIALSRAMILQEDYIAAVANISKARRAYGPLVGETDEVWDELVMWEAIAGAALPQRLRAEGQSEGLSAAERAALSGERGVRCGKAAYGLVRLQGIGLNPFSGALSSMADNVRGGVSQSLLSTGEGARGTLPVTAMNTRSTAGIAVRSDIPADGTVSRAIVTAYSPSQSFAAAANMAAPTWRYQVPANLPASCRQNVLTVVAFQLR